MMICRICGASDGSEFALKTRKYVKCSCCGSICTMPECFETEAGQRTRYEQHHNSLSDDGYRTFLQDFIIPVLNIVTDIQNGKETNQIHTVLDYGSGPEPALCELLTRLAKEGRYLSQECEIRGWDPFFAPDTPFFNDGADLVTCLEVAEHFETPLEDMRKLASCVKAGGYAAIGTMLLPNSDTEESSDYDETDADLEAFKKWWYRSDSTHVAFYTLEGLKCCAASAGLEFIAAVTDRAFLFRKTV